MADDPGAGYQPPPLPSLPADVDRYRSHQKARAIFAAGLLLQAIGENPDCWRDIVRIRVGMPLSGRGKQGTIPGTPVKIIEPTADVLRWALAAWSDDDFKQAQAARAYQYVAEHAYSRVTVPDILEAIYDPAALARGELKFTGFSRLTEEQREAISDITITPEGIVKVKLQDKTPWMRMIFGVHYAKKPEKSVLPPPPAAHEATPEDSTVEELRQQIFRALSERARPIGPAPRVIGEGGKDV